MSLSIEIENRSPRNSTQVQELEQELEQERLKETRSQRRFIGKIYIISTICLLISLVQWLSLIHLNGALHFLRVYKYLGQLFIWLTFLALLCFMFFFKHIRKKSLFLTWSCSIVTAEMGTVLLIQPIFSALYMDVLYTLGLLGLLKAITVSLSLQLYKEIKCSLSSLQLWTGRFFLITAMGILMIKTLRDTRIEITFASFTMLPIIFFILAFGKALGSFDLFNENQSSQILFGILVYFNFAAVFSNVLVFLTALRNLL